LLRTKTAQLHFPFRALLAIFAALCTCISGPIGIEMKYQGLAGKRVLVNDFKAGESNEFT